jgi:parallel beta-helix repeat protein
MDQSRFDALARVLATSRSRRTTIVAAAAALAGSALAAGGEARRGRPYLEGPCGNGSRKANICKKDSDCCTNICNLKTGKTNKDKQGRCRCIRKGGACKANRNCCGEMTCTGKICGGGPGPTPEVCDVCASGCAYTRVDDAIADATSGAVISIDTGTYDEDLTIDKTLTLKNCNRSAVTLRNATAGVRTILFPDPAIDPAITLTIDSLTITSSSGTGNVGGGIEGFANLVLMGTATVTDCLTDADGGGVHIGDGSTVFAVTMNDSAQIVSNTAAGEGGGIFIDSYSALTMNGSSAIVSNTAAGEGGGAYIYWGSKMTMNGTATVSTNQSAEGGGIYLYGGGNESIPLTMNDSASVSGNTATSSGGGVYQGDDEEVLLTGQSTIASNTAAYGGGIFAGGGGTVTIQGSASIQGNNATRDGGGINTLGPVTMSDSSSLSGNTAGGIGGGMYNDASSVTMSGTASITGNTSTGKGGGIYLDDADITVVAGNRISTNTASDGGGLRAGNSTVYTGPTGVVINNTPNNCVGGTIVC